MIAELSKGWTRSVILACGIAQAELEAAEVDDCAGTHEEIETENSIGGEAVVQRANLDLEVGYGQGTCSEAIDALGEDDLGSAYASDTSKRIKRLRNNADIQQPVRGEHRAG